MPRPHTSIRAVTKDLRRTLRRRGAVHRLPARTVAALQLDAERLLQNVEPRHRELDTLALDEDLRLAVGADLELDLRQTVRRAGLALVLETVRPSLPGTARRHDRGKHAL